MGQRRGVSGTDGLCESHAHVVCHASAAESMPFRLLAKKMRVKLRPNLQLR